MLDINILRPKAASSKIQELEVYKTDEENFKPYRSGDENLSKSEEESEDKDETKDEDSEEESDSEDEGFSLHQGEILETFYYNNFYSIEWENDYTGPTSTGKISLPNLEDVDKKIIYKGVQVLLKSAWKQADESLKILSQKDVDEYRDKITDEITDEINKKFLFKNPRENSDESIIKLKQKLINDKVNAKLETFLKGYEHSLHGFITDLQFSEEGAELDLSGYGKLLESEDSLTYSQMLRSEIITEVIKTAGLIPIVDFTDLNDEVIDWTSKSSSGNEDSDASGDGSMSESEAWEWAEKVPYNHGTSTHDPKEAFEKLDNGTGADCYSLTAALYYIFNFKVGIKARDICYHSPYANSGSHHTIQLYRNGSWDDCAGEYREHTSTNFHVISSRSGEHVCRESGGTKDSYPAYSSCPYSSNG